MTRTMMTAAVLALAGLTAACDVAKVEDEKGRKITLVAPASQKLKQGETNRVLVAIARTGVAGPVRIKFDGLPSGVTVVETPTEIPADSSTATFTLHAENDAELAASRPATITAIGPGGMSVSERFNIDVVAAR